MKQEVQRISFYGKQIMTIEVEGEHYVAMKPVCENIGLQWESQYNRIKRHSVLCSTIFIMNIVAEDGRLRKMVMLPLKSIHGWLIGVDTNRVKPEIKERLVAYQKECFDVLHNYWNKPLGNEDQLKQDKINPIEELLVFIEMTRYLFPLKTIDQSYNAENMQAGMVLQYLCQQEEEDDLQLQVDIKDTAKNYTFLLKWSATL